MGTALFLLFVLGVVLVFARAMKVRDDPRWKPTQWRTKPWPPKDTVLATGREVRVARTMNRDQAELLASVLRGSGIASQIRAYGSARLHDIGPFSVYVRPEDAAVARELIAS